MRLSMASDRRRRWPRALPLALSLALAAQGLAPAALAQQGLIHRVIDDTDVLRYAACSIECSAGAHFDNHVHFKCSACQHTYCLSQVAIPVVQLPGGFLAERRDFLLSGVCQLCQPL